MKFQNLSNISLSDLHEAELDAYSDYVVPMNIELNQFQRMLTERAWSPDQSLGAFDDGKLVAFWLIGVSETHEPRTLYGLSVGTRPDWRRQGLAEDLFRRCVETVDHSQFDQIVLECITHNDRALAAYRKMGFDMRREVKLSRGTFKGFSPSSGVRVEPVKLKEARDISRQIGDWLPTWQNSYGSLEALPDDALCLVASDGNTPVGLGCFLGSSGQIKQLSIAKGQDRKNIARALVSAAAQGRDNQMRYFVNIDASDMEVLDLLEAHGWEHYMAQYEMVFDLT